MRNRDILATFHQQRPRSSDLLGEWMEALGMAPMSQSSTLPLLLDWGRRKHKRWTTHSKGPDPGRMQPGHKDVNSILWCKEVHHPLYNTSKHSSIQKKKKKRCFGGRARGRLGVWRGVLSLLLWDEANYKSVCFWERLRFLLTEAKDSSC